MNDERKTKKELIAELQQMRVGLGVKDGELEELRQQREMEQAAD